MRRALKSSFRLARIAQCNLKIFYIKPSVRIHPISTWNFKFVLYLESRETCVLYSCSHSYVLIFGELDVADVKNILLALFLINTIRVSTETCWKPTQREHKTLFYYIPKFVQPWLHGPNQEERHGRIRKLQRHLS